MPNTVSIAEIEAEATTELEPLQQYIQGLRELADFLEAHPEVKKPATTDINVFNFSKEELLAAVRAFGHAEKEYVDRYFTLRKHFSGGIHLDYFCGREQVCERVVVAARVVPAHIIPAQPEVEVPEKVEEVVEWRCSPLLGGAA